MTIPAKGWSVLRNLAEKRPQQHAYERKRAGLGAQTQALLSGC